MVLDDKLVLVGVGGKGLGHMEHRDQLPKRFRQIGKRPKLSVIQRFIEY